MRARTSARGLHARHPARVGFRVGVGRDDRVERGQSRIEPALFAQRDGEREARIVHRLGVAATERLLHGERALRQRLRRRPLAAQVLELRVAGEVDHLVGVPSADPLAQRNAFREARIGLVPATRAHQRASQRGQQGGV